MKKKCLECGLVNFEYYVECGRCNAPLLLELDTIDQPQHNSSFEADDQQKSFKIHRSHIIVLIGVLVIFTVWQFQSVDVPVAQEKVVDKRSESEIKYEQELAKIVKPTAEELKILYNGILRGAHSKFGKTFSDYIQRKAQDKSHVAPGKYANNMPRYWTEPAFANKIEIIEYGEFRGGLKNPNILIEVIIFKKSRHNEVTNRAASKENKSMKLVRIKDKWKLTGTYDSNR